MTSSQLEYFKKNEPQIFSFYSKLTDVEKVKFENQLNEINTTLLERQKELTFQSQIFSENFESFDDFTLSGNQDDQLLGERLINEGRIGCLVLAGGQGTRLQHSGPKGTFPISVIKHKSLFQLCAEKVKAASVKAQRPLFLAIMTSKENDAETRDFFKKNNFFGLLSSQLFFFSQSNLPLLDKNGHLFLEEPSKISMAADGNGSSLQHFIKSGILDHWMKEGIDSIQVVQIDNPLADPFDKELVGFHHRQKVEITLKCTEKQDPNEKVGVVIKQCGHCRVVEYTELSEFEKNERRKTGKLKHCCANLSLFCFSMAFIRKLHLNSPPLSLHKAWKASTYADEKGISHTSTTPIAWKFETYIFDYLSHSSKVAVLISPREECFAPLKNKEGLNSPIEVQRAIQQRERRIIETITELPAPMFPFELSTDFYYPTQALIQKWKGRKVDQDYVV